MRVSCRLLIATGLLLAAFAELEAQPYRADAKLGLAADASLPHRADNLLVKLRAGADPAALPPGARPVWRRWYQVPVPAGENAAFALERTAFDDAVELVELNGVSSLPKPPAPAAGLLPPASVPFEKIAPFTNDPFSSRQLNLALVGAPQAWAVSQGESVVVAVVDSGVHRGPDLLCRTFVQEYDAIFNQAGPGKAADANGHGTHVAGTIAQCTGNGFGAAGVAPSAVLMPVRVANAAGEVETLWLLRGLAWALEHGADVVNLSLGVEPSSAVAEVLEALAAEDVVVVAASGNAGDSLAAVGFPASYRTVIAVGSVGFDSHRIDYSQFGDDLDIVAPGGDLFADRDRDGAIDGIVQETIPMAEVPCQAISASSAACYLQGTSMATPHVAGAAAILRASRPFASREQIQAALIYGARGLGAPGLDPQTGAGLLRIPEALMVLDALVDADFTPCLPDPYTLCLNGGRFRLRMQWQDFGGQIGFGHAVQLTRESGHFWFFGSDNIEVVTKLIDACGYNQHFWVFAGGLTNVATLLQVEDLIGGEVRSYQNILGQNFAPIADTAAFATCP